MMEGITYAGSAEGHILELQKMKYMSSLGYFIARNCTGCLAVLLWAIHLERVERQEAHT
jgi:hypothetical protein